MKTSITLFALLATVTLLIVESVSQKGFSNISGAPASRTGSPFDSGGITCNTSGCHTGNPLGSRPGWITSNIPGSGYVLGQTYTVTATAVSAGCTRFGFEISPQTSTGANAGQMIITNAAQTHFAAAAAPNNSRWITHSQTGTAVTTTGTKTWTFDWTAPATGLGTITFYGAFNRTNSSLSVFGDSIFLSTLVVPQSTVGVWEVETSDFSFNVYPVPANENVFVQLKVHDSNLPEIHLTDISGKIIRTVSDAASPAQGHTININTVDLDSGIYFIRMISGSTVTVRKIVIL